MRLFKIKNTKSFMSHLFLKDTFDELNLINASIKTFCTYNIDGKFERNFFKNDENSEVNNDRIYCKWSELKRTATNLIKGHNTPLFMKFIFSSDLSIIGEDLNDDTVESLTLTVKFYENGLTLTSAVNRKNFSLDKSIDAAWDKKTEELLIAASLNFDEE
ncbi:DUF5721 family protein [Lachnospiraceae bacterium C1.1]|nr:DUF5721 family protein [Lachnospiraceae bacterium C1.1]